MKRETMDNLNNLEKLGCREFNPDITLGQIRGTNMWGYLSWGVSKLMCVPNVKSCVGLMLKVSGRYHKGWVLITLNGSDLYDVHIVNCRYKVLETITDIYFDNLFDVIDRKVERK